MKKTILLVLVLVLGLAAELAKADFTFGTPTNLGPTVNSSGGANTPSISADGLTLYFDSERPGGYGSWDIWVTTRETTDADWSAPVNLGPTVNSSAEEVFPMISADGLQLYFSEWEVLRPSGYGGSDMWVTTRDTASDPWGTPVNLGPTVNSSDSENFPRISADGSTLYFGSNRAGGVGVFDIWQRSILPVVDFNGDGIVDSADMCIMVDHWHTDNALYDIAPAPWGDGIVDVQDLIILAEHLFEDYRIVAHWKLDETEGDVAYDSVAVNDAVVFGGGVWQPTAGQVDGALQLDGIDDYVSTPFVVNPAETPLSVFAWIKGGTPGQVVISQTGGADWLYADSSEGNLMTELTASGRIAGPLLSQTIIADGNWHRVGFAWDGSDRILYVDDVEVARDTQPGLAGSQGGLYIGAGKNLEPGAFFSGLIDDVHIYNQAITP